MERTYIAIDLKSFYASVECIERNLNPLTTNLVVADASRTEKTICLAVSPALKSYGLPGRPRLFEVVAKMREVNKERLYKARKRTFLGKSYHSYELNNLEIEVDYIVAPPQMARYIEISTQIYHVYLKYVAPEDIHVYSIDEVFIDITSYLKTNKMNAHDFSMKMVRDVLELTGITATVGIGTNLYLAKIAMDILAKRNPPDQDGVRIATLDEKKYRETMWDHTPLRDFWRIGKGYATKLEDLGLYTMGDIARYSLSNADVLYKVFGINAELLIDHAWGYESCTMKDIKSYKPTSNSVSTGQVLQSPYSYKKAKLIVREMTEILVLDLVEKGLVTDQVILSIGYDNESLTSSKIRNKYNGEITIDRYGRKTPKRAHGSENIGRFTSSNMLIVDAVMALFDRIINEDLLVRRVGIGVNHVKLESMMEDQTITTQLDLFTDHREIQAKIEKEEKELEREKKQQQAIIKIKKKFGKNAILKVMDLEEGATTRDRNKQIGGHKS